MSGPLDPSVLNKAVHDSLEAAYAALPPDKNNAVLINGTYDQTAGPVFSALFVHRLDNHWTVAAEAGYSGPNGIEGKVSTEVVW